LDTVSHELEAKKELPSQYESWKKLLEWVEPKTKELALEIISSIKPDFRDVIDGPSGKDYRFDRGRRGSNTRFAVLMLRKNAISVRVRADPPSLSWSDPQNWTNGKAYKGWFFSGRGEEREFKFDSVEHLDYAMKLITQSYALAG